MGLKERLKRSLTLLSALLVLSCARVEESDAPYDPEGTNLAGGALATSPPTVTSLSPSAATQGSIVAIAGTNFDSSAVVNFGELSGTVIARSSALLRVKVPTGATSGSVFVTTSQGIAEAPSFGVLAKITSVSPRRSYPGSTVTLTGSGFTGVTSVRFGEVSVPSFTVVSDTSITCVFPIGGATSAPTVVKDAGSTTGAVKVARIFGVSSFSPVRGPDGTLVTISGGGFSAATSVRFGNVAASFTVVDDATIQATVPGTAPSASYLTINTASSKTVSATPFAIARVPSVTRFTPTSGTLPTAVRISGRELAGVTSISLGGHAITDFRILNGLLIELTIPNTIPSVTAPFTLTTSEGSVTTRDSFSATRSCLPGEYVTSDGTATQNRSCATCPAGSYSTEPNAPACTHHTVCGENERIKTEATSTSDRACEACPEGTHVEADQCVADSCPDGTLDILGDASSCVTLKQVAAGASHTCAITELGSLYCWGLNADGQLGDGTKISRTRPVRVGEATDWSTITLGSTHSCGLRSGALYCWGQTYSELTVVTSPTQLGTATDWSSVSAGKAYTCGLRGTSLYCWGTNDNGQLGDASTTYRPAPVLVGGASDWNMVAAGDTHTCGIRSGALYCWGDRPVSGFASTTSSPTRVGTISDWTTVSAGTAGTCGVRSNSLFCWSKGSSVAQVGTATDWQNIVRGTDHMCGLRTGGDLYCWGENGWGQLGDGTTTKRWSPVQIAPDGGWESVAVSVIGGHHTCAIRAGGLFCWGNNTDGQLGDGLTVYRGSPLLVDAATDWESADMSGHGCAIRGGSLYCWGINSLGQLGDGSLETRPTPQRIGSAADWDVIDVGLAHSCGIRGGALFCWGRNSEGQLGTGATNNNANSVPTQVGSATDWQSVSAGGLQGGYACGIRGGDLYCWGYNSKGQLGDGSQVTRPSPVPVGALGGWHAISTGRSHTCGIRNGALWCWGDRTDGRLGDGYPTIEPQLTPQQVGGETDWESVTAGDSHTCAIRSSGTLWCFGKNTSGQLGIDPSDTWAGAYSMASTPTQVGTLMGWSDVSTASFHTCALRDGAMFCWGSNSNATIAEPSVGGVFYEPTQIGSATGWTHARAGHYTTCGVLGGQLLCWGLSREGQLGIPMPWSPQPVLW